MSPSNFPADPLRLSLLCFLLVFAVVRDKCPSSIGRPPPSHFHNHLHFSKTTVKLFNFFFGSYVSNRWSLKKCLSAGTHSPKSTTQSVSFRAHRNNPSREDSERIRRKRWPKEEKKIWRRRRRRACRMFSLNILCYWEMDSLLTWQFISSCLTSQSVRLRSEKVNCSLWICCFSFFPAQNTWFPMSLSLLFLRPVLPIALNLYMSYQNATVFEFLKGYSRIRVPLRHSSKWDIQLEWVI